MRFIASIVVLCCGCVSFANSNAIDVNELELEFDEGDKFPSAEFWRKDAQRTLFNKLNENLNKNLAKNVIFFLGDGMSIPTVTASRIYEGQMNGKLGERNSLAMDKFPYVALSKTYCADKQVSDSACTATAYLCGIKANYYTIGLTANASFSNCLSERHADNRVDSIAAWAQAAGKATGIVTTTRVTHASPAGTYAHTANRNYESDYDIIRLKGDTEICQDIADQLVNGEVGAKFNVILGGGSQKFLPNVTLNGKGNSGERQDGRDLIKEWATIKKGNIKTAFNRKELLNIDYTNTDYVLGLFAPSHMPYHLDSKPEVTPTLMEMTEAAIKVMEKAKKGFFLFVEGGRIDHAHHDVKAHKALDETVEFSKAIHRALDITNPDETLIVVTADHGHTMTMSGYPKLGNSITGVGTDISDIDHLSYATLSYANGPGFRDFINNKGERVDLKTIDIEKINSNYPSAVPLNQETHGGGDVAVYATGPWAHLFTGVIEENAIPHLIGYGSCMGQGLTKCRNS